jgi:hypothetical protein
MNTMTDFPDADVKSLIDSMNLSAKQLILLVQVVTSVPAKSGSDLTAFRKLRELMPIMPATEIYCLLAVVISQHPEEVLRMIKVLNLIRQA